jgi:DNA-binding CsgD family transcriptional regulator
MLAEGGDLESGLALLDEALTSTRSMHQPHAESFALAVHAKFLLDAGELERAAQFCTESLSVIDKFPDPWTPLMLLTTTAGLALEYGVPERAARLLSAADAFSDATGIVLFPAWRADQQRFAEVAHPALGEDRFRATWDDARTLTLAGAEQEAMRFLDALPSGAPPITASHNGLSTRQVEVLRLVAAGKSNREIATALSISTNTVFHHITSILTKTNTANRTEAAAYAHRHGLTG